MSQFTDVIARLRASSSTSKELGTAFEKLMVGFLHTDPQYHNLLEHVWLWSEWPGRASMGGKDVGIDLVGVTYDGDYVAIQCKCYQEGHCVSKPDIDSFIATAGRTFTVDGEQRSFAMAWLMQTVYDINAEARNTLKNQANLQSRVIDPKDFEASKASDWEKLRQGLMGTEALRAGYKPLPKDYQIQFLRNAVTHYQEHDRGQLIMACGTGKTYTALLIADKLVGPGELCLYLVPSLALLGQAQKSWNDYSQRGIFSVCVCSDSQVEGNCPEQRFEEEHSENDDEDAIAEDTLSYFPQPASTDVKVIAERVRSAREMAAKREGLAVVFSTYQSLKKVCQAQEEMGDEGVFALVVCDEAHRTTGYRDPNETKDDGVDYHLVHDADKLRARRRLYMTATPKLFGDNAQNKAKDKSLTLWSMDDEKVYGPKIRLDAANDCLSFGMAVEKGLLTDYKVLIVMDSESSLPSEIGQGANDEKNTGIDYTQATKMISVVKGLSKSFATDDTAHWKEDPRAMRRVLLFASKIGLPGKPGTSKNLAAEFNRLTENDYEEMQKQSPTVPIVRVAAKHVDGAMRMNERTEALKWLETGQGGDEEKCRILCNVRCLTEGIDVPALDAVVFMTPRNSQIDVVQAVGRVMRNFRKGEEGGKRYGYILLPVFVRPSETGDLSAVEKSPEWKRTGQVINALRAHDKRFDAWVNTLLLHKTTEKPSKKTKDTTQPESLPSQDTSHNIDSYQNPSHAVESDLNQANATQSDQDTSHAVESDQGSGYDMDSDQSPSYALESDQDPGFAVNYNRDSMDSMFATSPVSVESGSGQFAGLPLPEIKSQCSHLQVRVIERCGDRHYWETWAQEAGRIAQDYRERIAGLVKGSKAVQQAFRQFLAALRKCINDAIGEADAIEMVAQHLVTEPVFDALFTDYHMATNNSVSASMDAMVRALHLEADFSNTRLSLEPFLQSLISSTQYIKADNTSAGLHKRQQLIRELYEHFFRGAFERTTQKLGIVYTPGECVDYLLRSVQCVLRRQWGVGLGTHGVHVLDPFAGTGTFMAHLMQSNLISHDDLLYKYRNDLHCNEIVLLAYYVADVNIETTYNMLRAAQAEADEEERPDYVPYDGILLTDTFAQGEGDDGPRLFGKEWFGDNIEGIDEQRRLPIRVIVGNPPYSVGQKSANDDNQNEHYQKLEARIRETYGKGSQATSVKALYDSYIKAFRWASDRVRNYQGDNDTPQANEEGGVVAFISNGSWLDSNGTDSMRRCIEREFTDVYVLNLRGNQRTQGEQSRREGGKVFGAGSRCPVALAILVYNPELRKAGREKAIIHYHDIGDYLTTEQKLDALNKLGDLDHTEWTTITPNDKADWLKQRETNFEELVPLAPEKKETNKEAIFNMNAIGVATNRDAWVNNTSKEKLLANMGRFIDFYNSQTEDYAKQKKLLKNDTPSVISFVSGDETKISWSRGLRESVGKGRHFKLDTSVVRPIAYRPFNKQNIYYDRGLLECAGVTNRFFPTPETENLVICVSGVGVNKPFSCIMTDTLPDLELIGKSQCFPLRYWVEAKENALPGFGHLEERSGVSGWSLRELAHLIGRPTSASEAFHWVYAVLHHPEWRRHYHLDLLRALPRLPWPTDREQYEALVAAGERLAHLHVHYESVEPLECIDVCDTRQPGGDPYEHYRVQRMQWRMRPPAEVKELNIPYDPAAGKTEQMRDRSTLLVNDHLTLRGIPPECSRYVVNGRPALDWLIERYAVRTDTKSGLVNDPNDYAREQGDPRYVVDLVRRVANVARQTLQIVAELPELHLNKQ